MSLTAAVSGFVAILLSLPVVQGQNAWAVTYTSTQICGFKGSTVDIKCSYRYPSRIKAVTTVAKRIWFTGVRERVDLRTVSEYSGRVQYLRGKNVCTLRITDLRQSDAAEYKFRFITNQPGGSFTGSPGVTLSVTALQLQVTRVKVCQSYTDVALKCHSSCSSAGRPSYVWFKNGKKIETVQSFSYEDRFYPGDIISCALKGYEDYGSASVYGPKLPSVSVSPSDEIVEGSSVTLTCSSDANPAANYTWYKKNGSPDLHPPSKEPQLVFRSIQSSDSGEFYCAAENKLGRRTSEHINIDVKYGPKLPSVSVSPSDEIVEGSSVTLTCSSDANPAAKYTWYKENEDSPKASGQNFTITDIRPEHSGNYSCEAQNRRGRHSNTLHLTVAGAWKSTALGTTTTVVLAVALLSVFIFIRKKKQSPEPGERPDNREQCRQVGQGDLQYASVQFSKNQADPLYASIKPAQPHRPEQEDDACVEYSVVKLNSCSTAPRTP